MRQRVQFESEDEQLIVLDGLEFAQKPWRYRVNTSGRICLAWPCSPLTGWYDDNSGARRLQEVAA
jgi:hypothetical protein